MTLSIIIAKSNDFLGLKDTLLAIDRQKFECEVIIKDSHSCSDTIAFLRENYFRFAKIRYIHSNDIGIYDAINQALPLCSGDHIWILGCGDIPHLNIIKDVKLKIGSTYSAPVMLSDGLLAHEYTGRLTPPHQGLIYCKEAYRTKRYDTSYRIISDRIFYDHYLKWKSSNTVNIKKPICTFLLNGLSSQKSSQRIILIEMLRYFLTSPSFKNFLRLLSSLRGYLTL
jgi:glycosyltransferase involved in cell wall biosynthesis